MGEGILGGAFRKSAPGTLELNIPFIAESQVAKIIRKAYNGKTRTSEGTFTTGQTTGSTSPKLVRQYEVQEDQPKKLYPRGFTPPEDYYVKDDLHPDNSAYNAEYGGIHYDIFRDFRTLGEKYRSIQDAPLAFFDPSSVQFRHLLEFIERDQNPIKKGSKHDNNLVSPYTSGANGNRPGVSYDFLLHNGNLTTPQYLASFIRTQDNVEDPTILGYFIHYIIKV